MYKFLKNLGLSLALLAGAETATLPNIEAQEPVKNGFLQVFVNNKCQYDVSIGVYIDGRRILGGLNKYNSPLLLKLYYNTYIISVEGVTNPYGGLRDSFQGDDVTDQRIIEINQPTSSLEVIINYDENNKKGYVHFGDFSNFFDTDNDSFLDDIEHFFGTNDNASNDNPNTKINIYVGKDLNFYTQNYNYAPTFSGAKTLGGDIQFYNQKIEQFKYEIKNRELPRDNLLMQINRSGRSHAEIYNPEWFSRIDSYNKEIDEFSKQIQELEKEKDKKCNEFLTNSNMFKFEREENSLKIFYKKYEDKEWKDITDQPNFYKNLK